jgi:ribosomal protein S16
VVKIDADRAQYWIGKGARPSDTVRSMLKKSKKAGAGAE